MTLWPELVAEALPKGDDAVSQRFSVVPGHFNRHQRFVKFPHACPGRECAIREWICRAPTSEEADRESREGPLTQP